MNLVYVVLGCIVVFAFCINLLYLANFKEEERHRQLFFPIIALGTCLLLIQFDERITIFFQQVLVGKFPFLEAHIQLLLNLAFIVVFLGFKTIWKLGATISSMPFWRIFNRFRWVNRLMMLLGKISALFYPKNLIDKGKSRLLDPGTVSLVYIKYRGKVLLKKEWSYTANFFYFASFLPVALLVLLIVANVYTFSFIQYLPKYPIVAFILLIEMAWFLNGRRFTFQEGSIDGKDAVTKRLATYEELFDQYEQLWGDRLLAKGKMGENELFHHRIQHFSYENISPDREHQAIINAICERLKKKNVIIDESYTTIMSEVILENDVMIEDVLYGEFASYFFPALYHLLTKNKKILVIAPSQSAAGDAVDWFRKGIKEVSGLEQVWKVSTFSEALEQNTNADVLIVSPNILNEKRFLHYLSQLEKTKILEGILFLQAEKILPNHSTILHAFNLNVRELIGKKPQYIILTEWYDGLEHTVRTALQCEPKDIVASANQSQNLHYMVWKKEGENWFQHTLLPTISHRQLEAEVVLSLPALKSNIEPVHFINQRKTNVKESIQEIMDAKRALFDLGFDLETLDQFVKMIQIHDKNLSIPVDDFAFLLIRDNNYNLVDALNLWKGTGKKASFVHVVCPPYLIRDYLANQLEFYMSTNRNVSPLAPRLSGSPWSVAYSLLERLCHFHINEEEVVSYLKRAQVGSYRSVVEGIHLLFTRAFGPLIDYRYNIESMERLFFDRSKKDFVEMTQYRIPYSAKEKILPKGFRFIEIRHNNKTISEIFEGHIYQQYLPGQSHSFNGELFKIDKVDLEHGSVEVSFQPIFEKAYYRPQNEYRISEMENEHYFGNKNISFEKFELSMSAIHAKIEIQTSGYFELNQLLNLKSMKVHSFHEEEVVDRVYENGHLLCIQIRSKEGKIERATQIEYTLAFLLNELFLSLFPDTHHFVKACALLGDSFFDENEPLSRKLQLITPNLHLEETNVSEGEITLYIIEDSPVHLGILEAIRDNWEKIFDILNDYLFWLLNESKGTSHYLHFGYDHYPKELALSKTYTILDEILTRKKLREVRREYLSRKEQGESVIIGDSETIQCIFCGRIFAAAQVEQLDDGRRRCFTCSQSAIDEVSQVEPLYEQVRQFFKDEYGVSLRSDIALSVLSTAEIHKMSGLPFIPNAGNPRLTGKASMDSDGNVKVLIENGSPRNHTLSTLAHELTHIWQFENLKVQEHKLEELEGFASWVEVDMMTKLGETPYANMLKEELMSRQDEYGSGFRLITQKRSQLLDHVTPFEMFTEMLV